MEQYLEIKPSSHGELARTSNESATNSRMSERHYLAKKVPADLVQSKNIQRGPILTYAAEIRVDTTKTKQILETAKMRIPRRITGRKLSK